MDETDESGRVAGAAAVTLGEPRDKSRLGGRKVPMLTVLIWLGSGFAFSVGIILGALLFRLKPKMTQAEVESLKLLKERNAIGLEQIHQLARIKDAVQLLAGMPGGCTQHMDEDS
jgi:hypothetical protein